MEDDRALPARRPAETATAASAAVTYLLARVFGFHDEPEVVLNLMVVIGLVPAAVTWIVSMFRKH